MNDMVDQKDSEFAPTRKKPQARKQLRQDIKAGDRATVSEEQMQKAQLGAQGIIEAMTKAVMLILKAPNRQAKRRLKAQLLRLIRKL